MLAHTHAAPPSIAWCLCHRRRRRALPCTALLSRRELASSAGAGTALLLLSQHACAADPAAASPLEAVFNQAAPAYPGPSFAYQRVLQYAPWLFGEWQCSSALQSFDAPKGQRFVPASAIAAAKADEGKAVPFTVRFYQTLPDSAANKLRVTLGSVPESAVVADRAFNIKSLTEATLGKPGAVESVAYDQRDSPDRVTVMYAATPPQKAELYLSALRGDDTTRESDVFYTAECTRQVSIGVAREAVSDYQILCRFERKGPDDVLLTQRVAVYLTPQDPAYFDVANAAVGVYTYTINMRRNTADSPDGGPRLACVETPKEVVQCI